MVAVRTGRLLLRLVLVIAAVLAVTLAGLWGALTYRPQALVPALEWGALRFLDAELRVATLGPLHLGKDASLQASGISVANPAWAGNEPLLSIGQLRVTVHLPSLRGGGSIIVRELDASAVQLDLQAPADGLPNWAFPWWSSDPGIDNDEVLLPVVFEHAELTDVNLRYRDPDRDVNAAITRLALQRDETTGLSRAAIDGRVNDLPLEGDGLVGPTTALQTGRDLSLDLDLRLATLEIAVSGAIEDTLSLAGADLVLHMQAPRARPLLDLLGLEEVRDGSLSFDGRLADARPGVRIEAVGQLAEFDLGVRGAIDKPRELDGVDLALRVGGPSLAEAGAIFGLQGFRPVPFDVSGRVQRRGTVLRLEEGVARADRGELRVTGVLPNFPSIDGWDARIVGQAVNLGVLGALAGIADMPALYCEIDGRLSSDDRGTELLQLSVIEGDLSVDLGGVVGLAPDFDETDLDARIAGGDLRRVGALLGLEALPETPFELTGQLLRQPDAWRVAGWRLAVEGLVAEASARLDRLVSPGSATGELRVAAADLPAILRELGADVELAAPMPLDVQAEVLLEDAALAFHALRGQLGEIALSGSGRLSTRADLAGSRLQLEGRGDSLGQALAAYVDAELQETPFRLSLDATYHAPLVELQNLQLEVGRNRLSGQLQLASGQGGEVARGTLSLSGASSRELLALAGLEQEQLEGPYSGTADVELGRDSLRLSNLALVGPENDLAGSLALQRGAVPRLDLDLRSEQLFLPFLWPEPEEPDTGAATQSGLAEPPSRKQLADRVIPDSPLPLDWLARIEGRWQYRVARAMASQELAARIAFDAEVSGGRLTTRELSWEGPVSTGWMDLAIDASQPQRAVELVLASHRLPLLWMLAGGEVPRQEAYYRARLAAQGANYRQLAASLEGAMLFRNSGARVSNRGLDLILGDVLGTILDRLNPVTQTQEFTEMECGVGAFRARDGLVSVTPGLVMRLDAVDIVSQGQLDLNSEALDITFNTRSRKGIGISAGKAITPYLKLAGNLAHPWITLDPEAVAISGTVAVATGGVSILAESLYDRWIRTAKSPCKELFKQLRREPDYQALIGLPGPWVDSPDEGAFNQ